MANYTAARSKHVSALAGAGDLVTLSSDTRYVEVVNRGAAEIYFTVDGSTPTVGSDDSFVVLAGSSLVVPAFGTNQVRLVSSGTPAYSVVGVDG